MMIVFSPLTNSQQRRASILAAILCSILLLASTSRSQAADSEIKRFETPEGVKYGV